MLTNSLKNIDVISRPARTKLHFGKKTVKTVWGGVISLLTFLFIVYLALG